MPELPSQFHFLQNTNKKQTFFFKLTVFINFDSSNQTKMEAAIKVRVWSASSHIDHLFHQNIEWKEVHSDCRLRLRPSMLWCVVLGEVTKEGDTQYFQTPDETIFEVSLNDIILPNNMKNDDPSQQKIFLFGVKNSSTIQIEMWKLECPSKWSVKSILTHLNVKS
jgi:hypothetical protein